MQINKYLSVSVKEANVNVYVSLSLFVAPA